MRVDLQVVREWIPENSHVLDLGCGDGTLLASLQESRSVTGYGLELSNDNIIQAIRRGVNVIQRDLNDGLSSFSEDGFDFILMTHALQVLKNPVAVIREMLTIGERAILTFPNFGHWRNRAYLGLKGKMPMSETLPHQWHNTPNIHMCTVKDFELLCKENGFKIEKKMIVDRNQREGIGLNILPNLLGEIAIYQITRR
jgi:methionine biosynthesis protein MetW